MGSRASRPPGRPGSKPFEVEGLDSPGPANPLGTKVAEIGRRLWAACSLKRRGAREGGGGIVFIRNFSLPKQVMVSHLRRLAERYITILALSSEGRSRQVRLSHIRLAGLGSWGPCSWPRPAGGSSGSSRCAPSRSAWRASKSKTGSSSPSSGSRRPSSQPSREKWGGPGLRGAGPDPVERPAVGGGTESSSGRWLSLVGAWRLRTTRRRPRCLSGPDRSAIGASPGGVTRPQP